VAWSFLDDDPAYLEMLAEVMPEHWPVRLFTRPADCIRLSCNRSPPNWRPTAGGTRTFSIKWHNGQNLIAQILSVLARGQTVAVRPFAQVCVVDYSMPAMNGLQVLERTGAAGPAPGFC
jgi:CheY-like chemotaxis protein